LSLQRPLISRRFSPLDDFYKLTHIPMGLNDLKGNVLGGVGWQDICTKFHRVHPEACKHCVESNIKQSMGVAPGEFKLFRCKNNMWDITTPIMIGEQQVGIIFSGQFFFEGESPDYELFRSQARQYGFNEEEYIAALEKVPRLSRETVDTGMSFLAKLANVISQLSYSNIRLAQSLAERDVLVDALRMSEERERARSDELAAVLDAVPVSVYITHDLQALQITGNRLSYEWLRLPVGANLSRSAPEGERPETFRLLKEGMEIPPAYMPSQMAAAGIELNDIELDIVSADGEIRHVLGNARPLRDEQGNPRGSVSAFIDITERKNTEEALRLSNIYNRSLIEASLDPQVTIGRDGKITDVNGATEQVTGYSRSELIGTDFSDYFTEPEKAKEGYQLVFTDGEVRDYPLEIQHKDGHITPVLYNASVYKDENGEVIGVFAAARDITERKRAERALRESEEKYRIVADNTFDWEFWLDPDGRFLYTSPSCERVTGYAAWEFIDKPDLLQEIIHPDDRQAFIQHTHDMQLSSHGDIAFRIVTKDGEIRWIHHLCQPLYDGEGHYAGSRGSNRDIT
jgi:PAS domain S-box-containing protein